MRQRVREDNLTICYGETNNLQNYRKILPLLSAKIRQIETKLFDFFHMQHFLEKVQ